MNTNNPKPLNIACVGEAMIELSVQRSSKTDHSDQGIPSQLGFAGDTLNTAIYLKRTIGQAANVAFVSKIGNDVFSEQLLDFIAAENIKTDSIARSAKKIPGLYAITTDSNGERSFTYWRDNSAARELFQSDEGMCFEVLSNFDVIFFSGISLAILPPPVRDAWLDWLNCYRDKNGATIIYDSNYRPRLWSNVEEARYYMNRAWSVATLALPSVDDEQLLHGAASDHEVIDRIRKLGAQQGVLKRGEQGPLTFDNAQSPVFPAPSEDVIDTTAAGDSFNGAYIAHLLTGATQAQALLAAHECALKVITHRGAIIPREKFDQL